MEGKEQKTTKVVKSKYILSDQVAQEQIDIFLDFYEFDLEEMIEKKRNILLPAIDVLKKSIRLGRLEVKTDDDSILVVQKLVRPPGGVDQLKYKEVTGRARTAMKEDAGEYTRMYQLAGAVTGVGYNAISVLHAIDLKVIENMCLFFL